MRVADFDFDLPADRIALRPARPRDSARLLLVDGVEVSDHAMLELPGLLRSGDVLVFNDTKVIPAQLEGAARGERAWASIGATLHKRQGPREWHAFLRNAKRARVGDNVDFGDGVHASVVEKSDDGSALLHFHGRSRSNCCSNGPAGCRSRPISPRSGRSMRPTGPIIRLCSRARKARSRPRPRRCTSRSACSMRSTRAGIGRETLTLHVGAGTFLPVKSERIEEHKMHAEWGRIDGPTAERLNAVRRSGGRLISVGTTSLRLLESAAGDDGSIQPFEGDTAIFITPGYCFKAIDGLITNFHLPRSTLFMLVSALMGLDVMKAAYAHAIEARLPLLFLRRLQLAASAPGLGPRLEPVAEVAADELAELIDLTLELRLDLPLDGEGNWPLSILDLVQPRTRLRSERGFLPLPLPSFFCAALSNRPWCRALARYGRSARGGRLSSC